MKKILTISFIGFILKAHIITVDGDPSDWMSHSVSQRDTFFYLLHPGYTIDPYESVWLDEIDDDFGDGDYTYPTDTLPGGIPRFKSKEADLRQFRFTEGATSTDTFLYFLIVVSDTFNGGQDWPSFIAYFTIDTLINRQGAKYAPQYSDVTVSGEWQYSGVFSMYTARLLKYDYSDVNPSGHSFAHQYNVYEAGLKIDSLKLYHKSYWVSFGIGLEDFGNFREVDSIASQYNGGGGIQNWADPDLYDLAYINAIQQKNELSGYSVNTPVTITNAMRRVFLYVRLNEKPTLKFEKINEKINKGIYDLTGRKIINIKRKGIYINKNKRKILKIK
ncbi:MAG: glucodextranase DOMON-like domain-containing protein [candidate division WOR-3 bacterium]